MAVLDLTKDPIVVEQPPKGLGTSNDMSIELSQIIGILLIIAGSTLLHLGPHGANLPGGG